MCPIENKRTTFVARLFQFRERNIFVLFFVNRRAGQTIKKKSRPATEPSTNHARKCTLLVTVQRIAVWAAKAIIVIHF